jgi:phosphatidylinositol alpha-1,6-mannosyltransferase
VVTTVHHLPTAFAVSSAERFMTQLGASLSDRVVVTSDVMRIGLQSIGLPESKLVRIPVPVLTPGGVTRDSVAEVRSRYGLLPSAFLVGNTSRFAIHKGQLNLVKAVHLASAQCANLHLVLVGYGRRREEIQKYVVENCPKLVTFLQIDTELGDYYRALDLFAHLPSEEGFGIVYAEAALMGIASLGTRVGGVPIAIEDGVTGFLVEFGDIAVAADRIILACRNQKQLREMGVCARKRAQQEFNPERICQSYHQLYMR